MGCRHYFVANRLEMLVDEGDSRSSSRVHEHGSFLLVSQLHVAIQTPWSRCLFPSAVWAHRWIVHFQRISPFLHDLRLRFRLRLCLDLSVQQTLAHNWKQVSLFSQLVFWSLVGFVGSLHYLQQLLNPINFIIQLSVKENFGGGRGDAYTFS